MPRPCQRRRESAAAQRTSKPKPKPKPKPSSPPLIRHKARQKAIHNARHGRGRGGQPSRNQRSGDQSEANHDFVSFAANGNNLDLLNGAGSRHNPIALDEDDSLGDGELTTDDGSDFDDLNDLDMYDAEDMMINVQMDAVYRAKARRAEVMFSVLEAVTIYRGLAEAGFPLLRATTSRYGMQEEHVPHTNAPILSQYSRVEFRSDALVRPKARQVNESVSKSSSYISLTSSSTSHRPSTSTATSRASTAGQEARNQARNPARDYVFDWGAHKGAHFTQVPESYLRTIGGSPYVLDRHPGLKEAFDYHRPGLRRIELTEAQRARQQKARAQASSRGRVQGSRDRVRVSWEDFTFPSGAHLGERLDQVDESYLRTIEGMSHVMNKWTGLSEALQDYNARTGRRGRDSR